MSVKIDLTGKNILIRVQVEVSARKLLRGI